MSSLTVGIIISIVTVAALVWDVFLYTDKIDRNSISQVFIDASKKWPIIAFLWGFLMGHLYG